MSEGVFKKYFNDCVYETRLSKRKTETNIIDILPQMNKVAQGANLAQAEGLPAGLIICVTADGNREGPLA